MTEEKGGGEGVGGRRGGGGGVLVSPRAGRFEGGRGRYGFENLEVRLGTLES